VSISAPGPGPSRPLQARRGPSLALPEVPRDHAMPDGTCTTCSTRGLTWPWSRRTTLALPTEHRRTRDQRDAHPGNARPMPTRLAGDLLGLSRRRIGLTDELQSLFVQLTTAGGESRCAASASCPKERRALPAPESRSRCQQPGPQLHRSRRRAPASSRAIAPTVR